ncbi:unnamed protein product, partial [Choristocarpus tenellus]
EDRGIVTLTLNRPQVKNAFNNEIYVRLAQNLERAGSDDSVVVVIITGTGKYFSSGADLKEIQS